ncbi:hypothetical protein [Lewinella cohaerens]|uniref:hypothetical protein n=1 Tax=Lewinella cohaerens TaxID=70995 RepID=UPI000367C947|nr:hypothetical protein [Lewinella cohaerens]
MNLKPNLWTLIFALTAGAWFWNIYMNDSLTVGPSPEIVTKEDTPLLGEKSDLEILNLLSRYEITPAEYKKNRGRYVGFVKDCMQTQCLTVEYTGPSYYKIHRNEIDEFSKLDTGGYFYLIPIIEDIKTSDGACKTALTLAFTKERPETEGVIKELGANDKIYNFATPCPPLCEDELAVNMFCE